MNLFVFVVLFFVLLSQVYGFSLDEHFHGPDCVEEHVGLYYVGANSSVYYVPKGEFTKKHKIVTLNFDPSSLSYNYKLNSLLFLDGVNHGKIYEYTLDSQEWFAYRLYPTPQNIENYDNKTIFGNESNLVSDPLTGNFFFIHENNGIYVCDLTKKQCAEVLEPTTESRVNLAFNAYSGHLFWVEGSVSIILEIIDQEVPMIFYHDISTMNDKGYLFYPQNEGQSLAFYADCKFYTTNIATDVLSIHRSNGQNEVVDNQRLNAKLIMDSEPLNETLSWENLCKNVTCDDGVCVTFGFYPKRNAECIQNLVVIIEKIEIVPTGKPEESTIELPKEFTTEKANNVPGHLHVGSERNFNNTSTSLFFEIFFIIMLSLLLFCVICFQSSNNYESVETEDPEEEAFLKT